MHSDEYARQVSALRDVVWVGDEPWQCVGRRLIPMGLPHRGWGGDRAAVRDAVRRCDAVAAVWTDGWNQPHPTPWWWTGCDDGEYDVARLDKKGRRDVRAGLRRSQVKRVETAWLADNAWPVYLASHERYDEEPPVDRAELARQIASRGDLSDYQCWAAFVDDNLASYATCIILDGAVSVLTWKFDSEYRKSYPNNALLYEMTRHYLRDRELAYITNGARCLGHGGDLESFLADMGWRRIHALLRIEMTRSARLAAAVPSPLLRCLPGALGSKIDVLRQMRDVSRECVSTSHEPG